ncbi:MAG: 2-isopropylmalate synthase [Acidobacteria bacterium]|nr:MAG: 2-isopropylmalate synthase [Acidobacteriota bacterium]REK09255.1 MAG: 2-isopropylmalate synthase [Acidobacteriota bacterium]
MSTSSESIPHVRIFDTTLRDGEQSPGASMTSAEKLEVARQLAVLGVDVIEAGFPAASPDDLEAVRRIAQQVGTEQGPIIAGLARCWREDIDKAWEGVRDASKPRIHTFLATSDLHMERKLGMTRDQVLSQVEHMVSHARSLCEDVEFSPEDGSRSDPEFLVKVLSVAIEAGATTLNIPDTVGYAMPAEYRELIAYLIQHTPGGGPGSGIVWSAHCHDDLGCATANTLAAIEGGARQVEVTINGIGERAGNTPLEEVVMALHTRPQIYRATTRINTTELARTSRLVANYTGIHVPRNKAIVGQNAFAHEAGIHQDGMLKDQRTYEIMTPQTVGLTQSQLVLGKHSGKHALRIRLEELGFHLDREELADAFRRFKRIADQKKNVTDADLQALANQEILAPNEIFSIEALQVTSGQPGMATATVRLEGPNGNEYVASGVGTGPVDAVFRAIDAIVEAPNQLVEYSVHSVTAGIDAVGEVTVRIESVPPRAARVAADKDPAKGKIFGGYGADTDIIIASAKAYLAAVNRMIAALGTKYSRGEGGPATLVTQHDEQAEGVGAR